MCGLGRAQSLGTLGRVTARATIRRFLDAVEARDALGAAAMFAADASYQNVPYPPVIGPEGVATMLADILAASTVVHWQIVSEAYAPGRGHLERVDRFVIDGVEHAVRCHGVFEVDEALGLITGLRDYVDLGPWRSQIAPALEAWRAGQTGTDATHRDPNTIG